MLGPTFRAMKKVVWGAEIPLTTCAIYLKYCKAWLIGAHAY